MTNIVTLINLNFRRTQVGSGIPTTHVEYAMHKTTPFGRLSASKTVLFSEFLSAGAEKMDWEVYQELGETLNREELDRLLEMGANIEFGYSGRAGGP